jgi:hypothetical protein
MDLKALRAVDAGLNWRGRHKDICGLKGHESTAMALAWVKIFPATAPVQDSLSVARLCFTLRPAERAVRDSVP